MKYNEFRQAGDLTQVLTKLIPKPLRVFINMFDIELNLNE